jgi:hypothetical protein
VKKAENNSLDNASELHSAGVHFWGILTFSNVRNMTKSEAGSIGGKSGERRFGPIYKFLDKDRGE